MVLLFLFWRVEYLKKSIFLFSSINAASLTYTNISTTSVTIRYTSDVEIHAFVFSYPGLTITNISSGLEIVNFSGAGNIVGEFLFEKDKAPLYRLVFSENLWEWRIAIVATFYFIRNDEFDDTLKIAEILFTDKEDLIHKAVGWMLREVGKRVIEIEEEFLEEHYLKMPRTMLRYAIERFPETRRKMYLKGQV